jgi:hypothetical protein
MTKGEMLEARMREFYKSLNETKEERIKGGNRARRLFLSVWKEKD